MEQQQTDDIMTVRHPGHVLAERVKGGVRWQARISTDRDRLEVVDRLRPERAYFTHICHDLPHEATCARLPAGVELAYDGLVFDLDV